MLAVWFFVSFGLVFFARDLQFIVLGWPLSFWLASQGIVLIFVSIVAIYASLANRAEAAEAEAQRGKQGAGL
jgi:cation/acetate symporter